MGTKNNPGAYDCLAKAEPDEPFFVLLARDKHAPALVWMWATLRELDGEDPAKVQEARQCVADMMAWAVAQGRPIAGFGQATLAGVMDLIRTVNAQTREETPNSATDLDVMRRFLAACEFERDGEG
jgi:hypothetical protein